MAPPSPAMKPTPPLPRRIVLTGLHAYPEDYRHLLTQPCDPEIGVTTTEDGGW